MPVSARERRYAAMRSISVWIDYHRMKEHALRPPHGTVGVGDADFDHLLKATVGEAYLRVLRHGSIPQDAHAAAVADGNDCVARWNSKTHKTRAAINGYYELKRWDKAGEAEADSLHTHFLNLLKVV